MRKIKKLFGFILVCVMMLSSLIVQAAPVEPERPSSLTVKYGDNETGYEGETIDVYRVAEVFEDGTYALTGAFAKYPVNIYGITTQKEWEYVRSTLASYIVADDIEPDYSDVTDEEGCVSWKNILPGIYLVSDVVVEDDRRTLEFESFLVVVPTANEDGTYNYDIVCEPKCVIFELEGEGEAPFVVQYKVVKQWKDYGKEEKRPDAIEVGIYKDGILDSTIELSEKNNWTYVWKAEIDGSIWTAVEKDVPEGYSVTITEDENVILITNACKGEGVRPETGDQTSVWPYILGLCCSGLLLIIVGIWRKRKF